jgi:hypothetical protein
VTGLDTRREQADDPLAVTGCNVAFLLRGELNRGAVVRTARMVSARP